ncbi:MAG: HEAT repeat domain-containing protein [Nitrospinota bacterium]|nr:HEAT repeat domain-containing protein [Nitrospinota bacterium]
MSKHIALKFNSKVVLLYIMSIFHIFCCADILYASNLDSLKAELNSTDKTIRAKAAHALGYSGQDAVDTLIGALNDTYWLVKHNAALSLGAIKSLKATPALEKMLNDDNPALRIAALSALKDIGRSDSIEPIIKLLRDGNENVRLHAISALSIFKTDSIEKNLLDTVNNDNSILVKRRATEALESYSGKDTMRYMLEAMYFKDKEILLLALRKLSNSKDPNIYPHLISFYDHCDNSEKMYAIAALGVYGDKRALSRLIAHYDNNMTSDIRESIIQAFGALDIERTRSYIFKAMYDIDPKIRVAAAHAFANSRNLKYVKRLIMFYHQENNPSAKQGMMWALMEAKHDNAIYAIIESLEDNDPLVRAEAAKLMNYAGDKRAIRPLVGLISDKSEHVREEAFLALAKITGEDYGMDKEKWFKWWKENKKKFENLE